MATTPSEPRRFSMQPSRRPLHKLAGAALLGALFLLAYLALIEFVIWKSNAWHQSGSPVPTELPGLPECSLAASDFPTRSELEYVIPQVEPLDSWLPILHAWDTQLHGEPRRIVFKGAPAMTSHGTAIAAVQLFDKEDTKLGEWTFWPGSDIEAAQVSFHRDDELGGDVIAIASGMEVNPRDTFMQIFAFSGDVLYLIRLEDNAGGIVPNCYYPGGPLGVLPGATSVDEWIAMFESRDVVQILAVLTYLSSRSMIWPRAWIGNREPLESIHGLRANVRIRELVARYEMDDRPWLREAAQLAAETMK